MVRRLTPKFVLALILLATALIRIHLLPIPLERDEGEYAYAGQLILQGIPPYSVASNMKLPGTYAAHAVIMAIFGQTIAGIHFGLLLVNALTILLVYFLGKRLFGENAGIAAAAAYASLSLNPDLGGAASHATHFVTLFALAATVLLIRRTGAAFWPGILYGLAFLMKQHGVFFMLFGALYLVRHRSSLRTLATFAAAAVLPYALTCLILWRAGVFPNFWFWTVTYASAYAARIPLSTGIAYLTSTIQDIWTASPALWVIAGLGSFRVFWMPESRPRAAFAVAFLAFSFATACPGLLFREHYFIPMLPAVALLAGVAVQCSSQFWLPPAFSRRSSQLARNLLAYSIFAAAVAYPFFAQRELYFHMTPVEAAREIWGDNPFPEAISAAEYIRQHTSPNALIAVLGSEPEIYFYAHRHSATPYIYMYGLMEPQPYALKMQNDVIRDLETTHPEYIVDVDVSTSWLVRDNSNTDILDWWENYQPEHYDLAESIHDLSIYKRKP
ncbi:MAG: glycosyltransferase family 39 protein [Bryobacteraceae bacterium]|jgi:4-amino-4-deoxy-L-arabinose transferase-like glycosyltransferase